MPASAQYHAVQFYGTDDRLFSTVSAFLAEGLIVGEPAMIVAPAPHRDGMLTQLGARLIHVDKARRNGDLLVLDADDVLGRFMVDGLPDPELFEAHVGRFVDQVLQGRRDTVLRAYGGMVDMLCQRGQLDAAIKLETLWNGLASRFRLALLCGYAMDRFATNAPRLQDICSHHTHIFGPEHARPFRSLTH